MSTVLNESTTRSTSSPAHRLRVTMAAVRLSISWFGTRKTLTTEQRAIAAESFGAEGDSISAGGPQALPSFFTGRPLLPGPVAVTSHKESRENRRYPTGGYAPKVGRSVLEW